jgi:hypothetical protein
MPTAIEPNSRTSPTSMTYNLDSGRNEASAVSVTVTVAFYSQSRVQELLACSTNRIHIGFLHKAHLKYHSGAPSGRTQSVHQHRERGRDSNYPSEY